MTQRYAGGEVVGWTGPPDSDTPAPRTQISESAPATDVLDVAAGSTGAGGAETAPDRDDADGDRAAEASAPAAETDEGGDTLPLVLSRSRSWSRSLRWPWRCGAAVTEAAHYASGRRRTPSAAPARFPPVHLRSLRLRGFKSFPDTLELKFEPGVAVVVGPNGSGKSNVADAIVWAAGSLAPSELRAEKPDDVLFNGAEGRTPAESCEVELVFDNESGDFGDLEFSEVSIARRLHRGGEGQYLVNKAQVRRTDLVELLADVGLGGSMHSIVSQGKVEAVLASKPEERRALVEEAAGLGKFKRRQHRAELKLARVGIQVERARDVEAEVRKRLRPLALQATAAERAEKLVDQIAGLRARIAQLDLEAAEARREAAEERKTAAGIGRRGAHEKLQALLTQRQAAEDELADAAGKREAAIKALYRLQSASERIALRQEGAQELLERLRADLADADAPVATTRRHSRSSRPPQKRPRRHVPPPLRVEPEPSAPAPRRSVSPRSSEAPLPRPRSGWRRCAPSVKRSSPSWPRLPAAVRAPARTSSRSRRTMRQQRPAPPPTHATTSPSGRRSLATGSTRSSARLPSAKGFRPPHERLLTKERRSRCPSSRSSPERSELSPLRSRGARPQSSRTTPPPGWRCCSGPVTQGSAAWQCSWGHRRRTALRSYPSSPSTRCSPHACRR